MYLYNNQKYIVIISAVFPPEQVTSAYLNYDLAKELSKEYKVIVLRPRPTRPIGAKFEDEIWQDPNFETIQIDSYTNPKSELKGRFKEALDFSRKCNKYIKSHHKEISFVYNDAWQLFGLYLIAKTCVKYNIPYIVPIQDIYPESLFTNKAIPRPIQNILNPILLYFDKYYQKHANLIRTISKEMADYLSQTRNIDDNKYLIINNWQNDEDFVDTHLSSTNTGPTFAYVGSINAHANVDLIIKAFVKANIPNSQLKIYGGGNQKDNCIRLVKELGVSNISFDFVSRKDIPHVQAEADVLVLALPKGNGNLCLPSKLTSYLLSGKPVIASVDYDSSSANILLSEKCGLVAKPDDLNSLSLKFQEFSSIPEIERKNMAAKSKAFAQKYLTRKSNLDKIVKAIKSNLKNE